MDPVPGEEDITAWSRIVEGRTSLGTYKAQIILAGTDWSNDFNNQYSSAYLDLQETLNGNMKAVFNNPAMPYAASTIPKTMLKMDEFVFKRSQQDHVVANWKLYFKQTDNPLPAEKINDAIEGVVSGETHKKFALRRTPLIGEKNTIFQNLKYFQITDIDECALEAKNDCDQNAKCINTPGNFKCLCRSNYDDMSNMTALPPGRICRIDPDRPEEFDDDLQYNDVLVDSTMPENSVALQTITGRPVKERLYGPNVWIKKYRYCVPGKIKKSNNECQTVFTYRGYATLELSEKQKADYKPHDAYDRESFTYKNLTEKLGKF